MRPRDSSDLEIFSRSKDSKGLETSAVSELSQSQGSRDLGILAVSGLRLSRDSRGIRDRDANNPDTCQDVSILEKLKPIPVRRLTYNRLEGCSAANSEMKLEQILSL